MQLEQIVVGMRPRTGWETLDLGFALVRHAFRDIYLALLVVALPLGAVAAAVGELSEPWIGWLIVWMAKPIFDAVTLSVLARALIGERSPVRRVFSQVPRAFQGHLIGDLTLRRFSPSRTFTMPVRHLEGLTAKAARKRIATLSTNHRGTAQLACVVLMMFEIALVLCGLRTVALFITTPITNESTFFPDNLVAWVAVHNHLLAELIIEPAFAAIGFALYVNRRVELEGWDIELAFRALKARSRRKNGGGKVAAMVAAVVLMAMPMTAIADPTTDSRPPTTDRRLPTTDNRQPNTAAELIGPPTPPAKVIKEVLAHPDFDPWRPTEQWVPIEKPKEDEQPEINQGSDIPFAALGAIIAEMMPYVLGGLGVLLVAHLVVIVLRNRGGIAQAAGPTSEAATEELAARKPQLPEDVVAFARAAWQRGEQALALSTLYRGAIGYFASVVAIDFPEGATEQECVALVRRRASATPASEAFTAIARTWQRCAYAHALPSSTEFDNLSATYAASFVAVVATQEPGT